MNSKFLALSKSVFFGLAFIAIFSVAQKSVRADTVTYSTAGVFSASGTNTFTNGGLTLTYTGANGSVNSPSNASLGFITATATGPGTASGTLTINITQTVPSGGSGSVMGTLSGNISTNSSTGQITFTVTSAVINGVTYTVTNNPLSLVPPSTCDDNGKNCGKTSIQGAISGPAVPEPASLLLFATGLTGVAGFGRKWLRSR